MSQSISVELQFFAISILWGAIVLLAYDQLRVLRRIIRHNNFWVTVEDLIFWITASVFIFAMIYEQNSGTIRGFSVLGMCIGMIIYHFLLSDFIVRIVSRGILFLLYPFSFALKCLKKGFKFILDKGKKLMSGIYRRLKNLAISVKINLVKKKSKHFEENIGKKKKQRKKRKNKENGGQNKKAKKVSKKPD